MSLAETEPFNRSGFRPPTPHLQNNPRLLRCLDRVRSRRVGIPRPSAGQRGDHCGFTGVREGCGQLCGESSGSGGDIGVRAGYLGVEDCEGNAVACQGESDR